MASKKTFVVVQDMFLTETAQRADVVLPAASAYEKNGTVTNVCGEVQRLTRAVSAIGAKTDLEIIGLIAKEMGLAATVGPWVPDTVYNEIRRTVKGYNIPLAMLAVQRAANRPGKWARACREPAGPDLTARTTISSHRELWDGILKYCIRSWRAA